jgi:hypothetical protein
VLAHDLGDRLRVVVHGREDLLDGALLGEARVVPDPENKNESRRKAFGQEHKRDSAAGALAAGVRRAACAQVGRDGANAAAA